MAKKKAKRQSAITNSQAQTVKGEQSKELKKFKKEQGLATWKEIQKEEQRGLVDEAERKIRQIARYNEQQNVLIQTMTSAGWSVVNVLHNITDLQSNLFDLEEKLRNEGINPLESPEYMKAREMLNKQIEFVHKHKIDAVELQLKISDKKEKMDDDTLFEVS
jgi:hypothetical protein